RHPSRAFTSYTSISTTTVDKTRRPYRHHGRQRGALRRNATFHHATLRVATHRYATLEPLGKPGGSRAFSPDGPPQSPVAPENWNSAWVPRYRFIACLARMPNDKPAQTR